MPNFTKEQLEALKKSDYPEELTNQISQVLDENELENVSGGAGGDLGLDPVEDLGQSCNYGLFIAELKISKLPTAKPRTCNMPDGDLPHCRYLVTLQMNPTTTWYVCEYRFRNP